MSRVKKIFVIDSTAIFFKKILKPCVTVPDVIDEIKDEYSRLYLSISDVKVKNPSEESIKHVKEISRKTGDIHRLSNTDIKLVALAIDEMKAGNDVVILTDDYSIQNLANSIGIKTEGIVQKGITKTFKWIKVCGGCGRILNNESEECPICGSKPVIRRVDVEKDRRSN